MSTDTNTERVQALAAEVEAFNAWRRGDADAQMPSPYRTTRMLDEVSAILRALAAQHDALRQDTQEQRA